VARSTLQARHGVAELAALERLQEELARAGAHAGDHGLAVGMEIGNDGEQIGRRLLHLLDTLDRGFRIARDIDDQSRARMPLEILQHADIQVGRDFLILRDHLGVRNIEQVVANHLAEMFVARSDQQSGVHWVQLPEAS
jgi:hypothetical protein